MRAAILQCDTVLDKFQHEFGDYPEMIKDMFTRVGASIQFDTFDCQQGHQPQDINAYDFFITTGSKASVYDGLPWVDELVRYIQTLDTQKKKLIGICFGHELIALAKGVEVRKSDKGWGIGIAHNQIIARPDWMIAESDALNLLVSHQDQIMELPEQATVIAESEFCPYFVVQWNEHFFSVQGHPEWSRDYSRALMNNRRAIIPAERIERGCDSLSTAPDNALVVQWMLDFVQH